VNLPSSVAYQYDANGNLTSDGLRSFTYDDEDQLISVIVTNGAGSSTRSDFSYDGRFRRRKRIEYAWSGGAWATNAVVWYVYDGNTVIAERDGNNTPLVAYTRGRDLSGSLQGAGGIGGLLARADQLLLATNNSGAHTYYHADAGGNITFLINTNQALVAKYLYDPFGKLLNQSGSLAATNLYRFSSKEFHPASGLSYYLYRFYDPSLQRWLNQDPIGEAGGLNLYGYVYNNPISLIDPLGLVDPVTGTIIGVGTSLETGGGVATAATVTVGGTATTVTVAGTGATVTGTGVASVAGVGIGTVAVGVGGAVVVGGAIGYGASQLPVVGGGTVADFYGDVIYDVFYSKPVPLVQNMAQRGVGNVSYDEILNMVYARNPNARKRKDELCAELLALIRELRNRGKCDLADKAKSTWKDKCRGPRGR